MKITDFGLARTKWGSDPDEMRLTAQGAVLGTPLYMAPEQYEHAADADHRADIYALGATAYHALAGVPPFRGRTVWDVIARKRQGPPSFTADVSRESAALIAAMMAPDPADRVATYESLIERIDQLTAICERPPRPRRSAPPWVVRRRWRIVGGCAGGVYGVWRVGRSGAVARLDRR